MFCAKCGTELPENAAFCSACGSEVANRVAGKPQFDNPAPVAVAREQRSTINPKLIGAAVVAAVLAVTIIAVIGIRTIGDGGAPSGRSAEEYAGKLASLIALSNDELADTLESQGYTKSGDSYKKGNIEVSLDFSKGHRGISVNEPTLSYPLLRDEGPAFDKLGAYYQKEQENEFSVGFTDVAGGKGLVVGFGGEEGSIINIFEPGSMDYMSTIAKDVNFTSSMSAEEAARVFVEAIEAKGYEHVDGDQLGKTSAQAMQGSSEGGAGVPDEQGEPEKPSSMALDGSSYDVVTEDFAFNIPEYWKGKVEWKTWEEDGYWHAVVYPKVAMGYVDGYFLVHVHSADPSMPRSAGDYIYHKVETLEEDGKCIDIRSKNWPAHYAEFFYSNPNYAGSSQEDELMGALIDLCCGGKELPNVREQAKNASRPGEASKVYGMPDADFLASEFVPNVVIVSSQSSVQQSQDSADPEPIDYAARAEQIANGLFTNAVDQGGFMEWTDSDVFPLIVPDSDAARHDQLKRLHSSAYIAIAKQTDLLENDGERRKYRVQVVYEKNLNDDGSNRQANIAEVGLWLNEEGLAERLTIDYA